VTERTARPTGLGRRFLDAPDIGAFLDIWLREDLLIGDAAKTFEVYYGSYHRSFSPRVRSLYSNQIRETEALVRASRGTRVLEVGCGLGTESLWLALLGANVTALDVRPDRIAAARDRHDVLERETARAILCDFRDASLLDLPSSERFDVVWMEQAFHHLEPRADIVACLARLVVPGGHLVISEANALNPVLQAELFLRRGWPKVVTRPGPDGRPIAYGDERVTSARALSHLLHGAGFTCASVRHFRIFPNRPVFDALAGPERLLARNWLAPLLTHFNYVGERRP
jgi:SAM-dependent methyltransferase